MAIVDALINDLVDKNEVLANRFFRNYAAVVAEHFHHAVNDIKHKTRRHVLLHCGHEVYSKFQREKIVHAIDVLQHKSDYR
jgi:dihydrofolate reductase